jgi:hypothetical protein
MGKSEGRGGILSALAILAGLVVTVGVVLAVISFMNPRLLVMDRATGTPSLLKSAEARLDDVPAIVEAMRRGAANERWAALTFNTPDRPSDDDAVNLNLSIENGNVGFDWVLIARRNIEDKAKFQAFARSKGVEPVSRSMNGVSYLRVETGDVAKFSVSIVTAMYGQPSDEPLALVHQGFAWPQD